MMYVRFLLNQAKVVGMVIIAFFIFPFVTYPKRREIWEMRHSLRKKWYWKFADSSETGFGSYVNNYLNSTYGLYELVKKRNTQGKWVPDYERFAKFSKLRKWFIALHWSVFRNGAWNYITSNKPPTSEITKMRCIGKEGFADCRTVRNKYIHGFQSLKWSSHGKPYFLYSYTRKVRWFNIQRLGALIFTWKNHTHYTFVWGASIFNDKESDNRFLIKSRIFNLDEI